MNEEKKVFLYERLDSAGLRRMQLAVASLSLLRSRFNHSDGSPISTLDLAVGHTLDEATHIVQRAAAIDLGIGHVSESQMSADNPVVRDYLTLRKTLWDHILAPKATTPETRMDVFGADWLSRHFSEENLLVSILQENLRILANHFAPHRTRMIRSFLGK